MKDKYLKYKKKYLELKKQNGGTLNYVGVANLLRYIYNNAINFFIGSITTYFTIDQELAHQDILGPTITSNQLTTKI